MLIIKKMDINKLSENHFIFSSESVKEGLPDKIYDSISDCILVSCLTPVQIQTYHVNM